jgi:hypothetical protein
MTPLHRARNDPRTPEIRVTPFGLWLALFASWAASAAPDHVDITWLSIANVHFDVGSTRILADGGEWISAR